jgi:hypothetical protein
VAPLRVLGHAHSGALDAGGGRHPRHQVNGFCLFYTNRWPEAGGALSMI